MSTAKRTGKTADGMGAGQRTFLIVARLFFGLLTLAAIISQLAIQIQNGYSLVNFFSYFTNLSNILAAIVLLIGGYNLFQRRQPTLATDLVRGTAAVSMAVVGIVFSILLRNEDVGSLLPWVNAVLHYIMPVVMVLDWLYQPPKSRFVLGQTWYLLIFPFIYIVYTLIRGAIVGFYPYPFLNPAKVGGYGGVALYCLAILVLFILLSWLFMFLGNSLKRHVE
ncbi:MAG TPA: Pr6Pr family membrane protein [Ktedonobacteraceae bacterium]|nr:Pr6Pr family membrane protein [Ktedonobacteraceae bacterium]